MPGGLFQLTAIAKEDIYLNVNLKLVFFVVFITNIVTFQRLHLILN